jgi:hypothetical protein
MPVVLTAPMTRPSQLRSRRSKAAQACSSVGVVLINMLPF